MEFLLNTVWAGIGAALLLFWGAPKFVRVDARRSAIALLALLCVICILFPIVSMTDDLSASPAEPETPQTQLAMLPPFLMTSGAWTLVYDRHASVFRHDFEAQPNFLPPAHAFLSFLVTRRPPPQVA